MLEELKKYDNLGTPNYFWELLHQLKNDDVWTEKDILAYFSNKIIDDRNIFDGCIPLLKFSNIISVNDITGEVEVKFQYKHILHSKQLCKQKLLEGFLLALHKDEKIYSIFSSEYISNDFIYRTINIDFSAFGLKYANIRDLLIDFEFFKAHPDFSNKKLIINSKWKNFFDANFAPEIRRRKIGIEELRKQQEQQQINGEIAEKFILEFEKIRLNNKDGIQWIAPYDSGAGYDILSYQKLSSENNDRFIEVKGYAGTKPYFYWTINEMETARKHSEDYFIYLVNRDKISEPNYKPVMISDPVKNILENSTWNKKIDKYYIEMT